MIKDIITYLLREVTGGQDGKGRFPVNNNSVVIKFLKFMQIGKAFKYGFYQLSEKSRYRVYYGLMNKFCIPWFLVPVDDITNKYREAAKYLADSHGKEKFGCLLFQFPPATMVQH